MLKLIRDSQLIFVSALRVMLRNPAWVFFGLFQPVCYMLLFAPLLKSLVGVPGFPSGGAYNVFTPGLMIMMAIFGTGFAGFTVIGQLREGVIERLRVTPVNRLASVSPMTSTYRAAMLSLPSMPAPPLPISSPRNSSGWTRSHSTLAEATPFALGPTRLTHR